MSEPETDAEFVRRARYCYGSLTGKERDRLFSIADRGVTMQWGPIKEAPTDGTVVLVKAQNKVKELIYLLTCIRNLPNFTHYYGTQMHEAIDAAITPTPMEKT